LKKAKGKEAIKVIVKDRVYADYILPYFPFGELSQQRLLKTSLRSGYKSRQKVFFVSSRWLIIGHQMLDIIPSI
jgi:hypothetical protein